MRLEGIVEPGIHSGATHFTGDLSPQILGRPVAIHRSLASAAPGTDELPLRVDEREAERTRIARDLHDTLLQGFFAASLRLHSVLDDLPVDCPTTKSRLNEVLQLLDRVLEEGRCAVQGLRSPENRISSLGEALANVPEDSGLPAEVSFQVVVLGHERRLRAGLQDEVYRIGREAIINALRHAHACKLETEIEYKHSELRLVVRDNGCGIDPLAIGRAGHWGLQGMRERAGRLGGKLRILSRAALGTEIELTIPSRIAFESR
ncbi:sensor histidine kinase [Paludibaculum fermentans]|uniref:sensor histidine kinase n=1 Tax=Paludibaculum fermentans TaxID=1473598 RepID=UPI003EBDA58E